MFFQERCLVTPTLWGMSNLAPNSARKRTRIASWDIFPVGKILALFLLAHEVVTASSPSTSSRFCKQAVSKLLLHARVRCLIRQVGCGNLFWKMPLASHFLLAVVGGGVALKRSSRCSWHKTRSVSTND